MLDAPLPNLVDANGNPIPVRHVMRLRLVTTLFHVPFVVVDSLSCALVLGTQFLNRHVDAIFCLERVIKIRDDMIPIIDTGTKEAPWVANPARVGTSSKYDLTANHIRFRRPLTLAPFSQTKARVITRVNGLIHTEPKRSAQERLPFVS